MTPIYGERGKATSCRRIGGMFRIRVKTGHKNTAEDFCPGKTSACLVAYVRSHSPRSSIRAKAGVRKRFCQSVIQQAVFTHMKRNRSSVREGLRFWTDFPMAGFYTYPELTHSSPSATAFTWRVLARRAGPIWTYGTEAAIRRHKSFGARVRIAVFPSDPGSCALKSPVIPSASPQIWPKSAGSPK
jgi:hypothetical protein